MTDTEDLIIPYRLFTCELKFKGHGHSVDQDLFLVGDRAAWGISQLIGDADLPVLDGGLTAGEWNKRALAIEAKVKAFAKGPVKPVLRAVSSGERPQPHPFPAVQGVLTVVPLLAPGSGPVPKILLLAEAQVVEEFLTGRNWPALRELTREWGPLPAEVRARLAERLSYRLRDMGRVPLEATEGLEIPHRVKTGEVKPAPGKVVTEQDLFLVGGRAAWAMYTLIGSGESIPLHGGLTVDEWNKRAALIETHVKAFVEENKPTKK